MLLTFAVAAKRVGWVTPAGRCPIDDQHESVSTSLRKPRKTQENTDPMAFVSIWHFPPGAKEKAARVFLKSGGAPLPEGAELISRYHFGDVSGGA